MSLNAASHQTSRSSTAHLSLSPSGTPSSSSAPAPANAPRLTQPASSSNQTLAKAAGTSTNAQRNPIEALCGQAQSLRWGGKDRAASAADVLDYFASLKAGAAQLHAIHDRNPDSPQLASCITAFGQALARINGALQRGAAQGGLDAAGFDLADLGTIFGALSALADPAREPLFSAQQRLALQPPLQQLASVLLRPHQDGLASATVGAYLPLLNALCRNIKKGLLKPDPTIATLFERGLDGMAIWIADESQEAHAYQIGKCATILHTVIEYDLLLLKRKDEGAKERSFKLRLCALQLCGDETFAVLEKAPVNGVAVINLCNLVKELVEAQALSLDHAQLHGQMQHLLTLIIGIPNEAMSGGDGRVLSNAGNFLRMLMQHMLQERPEGQLLVGDLVELLAQASRRVLAALKAEGFGKTAKHAQSLSNLASFVQDCHRHARTVLKDESLCAQAGAASGKLLAKIVATGEAVFTDRRSIDGVLAALDYVQEQQLCEPPEGLEALRSALRARQGRLGREKVAAPAPLSAMDAELPALTTTPKLSGAERDAAAAERKAEAQGKRIPGEGAIVTPPALSDAVQIVPGTTNLRPVAGKGKFARATRVKPDPLSLAAQRALAESADAAGDEDGEATEPQAQGERAGKAEHTSRHKPKRGGMRAATRKEKDDEDELAIAIKQADAPADGKPNAASHVVDMAPLIAAIRAGQAGETEQAMRQLRSLSGKQALPLPQAFLAEIGSEKFLAVERRLKALNTYLSNLGRADRQALSSYFREHPPVLAKVRELLAKHGVDVSAGETEGDRSAGPAQAQQPGSVNGAEDMGGMMAAAGKDDTKKVQAGMAADAKGDATPPVVFTELMCAAMNGYTEAVQSLVYLGAQVDEVDHRGHTALMYAAMSGHTATAQELVHLGAEVNAADGKGWTALMLAAGKGHAATVQELAKLGAKVDATDSVGWTALTHAAVGGHTATVQALARLGAKVEAADTRGMTALAHAAANGHKATVQELAKLGAKVDVVATCGDTVLMIAAGEGHTAVAQELARLGAKVDAADSDGVTALMCAALAGHTATVLALAKLGAKVDATRRNGRTALMSAARNGHTATAEELVRLGARVDATDSGGWTALMCAASRGHTATVRALAGLGADVNAARKNGDTALTSAARNGHKATVQALLKLGAKADGMHTDESAALVLAAILGE